MGPLQKPCVLYPHVSGLVQAVLSLQEVPSASAASAGQAAGPPVQNSSASHTTSCAGDANGARQLWLVPAGVKAGHAAFATPVQFLLG